MECTNEMLFAAIRQAVKEKLLPSHAPIDIYEKHCESIKRVVEAALIKIEISERAE